MYSPFSIRGHMSSFWQEISPSPPTPRALPGAFSHTFHPYQLYLEEGVIKEIDDLADALNFTRSGCLELMVELWLHPSKTFQEVVISELRTRRRGPSYSPRQVLRQGFVSRSFKRSISLTMSRALLAEWEEVTLKKLTPSVPKILLLTRELLPEDLRKKLG